MRRGGHSHPAAALRYQHATEDRDRAIADALAQLVVGNVTALTDNSGMSEREDSNGTGA